jgi:drug/metabolite transporter (DMT)-like permease
LIWAWIALGTSFTTTACGQVTYKLFSTTRKLLFLGLALGLFIAAQLGNYIALHRLDIGTVYIGTGITQVLVLALSRVILREKLTRDHIIAVALIVGGLALYGR